MPTWISEAELNQELDDFGTANLLEAEKLCGKDAWNSLSLMLAIASRETLIENIDGDPIGPNGHGKGCWQIDIRSWLTWLSSVPGVKSGTWGPVIEGQTAAEYGMVPTLQDGLKQALNIIDGNYTEAVRLGSGSGALRIAIAGYNAGMGGASEGWRNGGNPDRYTTGGNYSADVLQRQPVVEAWIVAHTPKPDPLAPLTSTERALVKLYQKDQKHAVLHSSELKKLKLAISVARKAVYRAAVDGIADGKKVEKGWGVNHRNQRYHILSSFVPPQS